MIDYQGQIDYMVRKFQDVTAKCEALEKKSPEIDISLNTIYASNATLQKMHEDLDKQTAKGLKAVADITNELNKRSDSHANNLSTLHIHIINLSNELEEIKRLQLSMKSITDNLTAKFTDYASQDRLDICNGNLNKLKGDLTSLTAIMTGQNSALSEAIESVDSKVLHFRTNLKNLNDLTAQSNSKLATLTNEHVNFKRAVDEMIEKSNMNLSNQIKDTISAIPKPIIPSMEEAKATFKGQLEGYALEARNAQLRSSNNEIKIVALEKKVENLTLLLNKLQIGG